MISPMVKRRPIAPVRNSARITKKPSMEKSIPSVRTLANVKLLKIDM
jgi:hypothetical protein